MKIWLLQLSQVFCWFCLRKKNMLAHYSCIALMCLPEQHLFFSLLQTGSIEELSDRRYSTLLWKNMTLCAIFWLISYSVHFWVLGIWGSWYSFGVIAAGWEDEAMDSCTKGLPSQYGHWWDSHESMDFQYIIQNIHVRIILKSIVIVVTAANTRT